MASGDRFHERRYEIAGRNPDRAERAVREHLKGRVSATEQIRSHVPESFG